MKDDFIDRLITNGATFMIIVGIFMLGYTVYPILDEVEVKSIPRIKIIQGAHIPNLMDYVDVDYDNNTITIINSTHVSSTGMSMQPSMFTGNIAILQHYDHRRDNLQEGWLVRYKKGNYSVIHRIRGVYKDYIITQGDSNGAHEHVNKTDVLDVVIGILFT